MKIDIYQWFNGLRQRIYSILTNYYEAHQSSLFLKKIAFFLQKIFGLAVFEYGGVKLLAGPVNYLDRFIITKKNINPYVTSALMEYLAEGGVFLDIGANHGVLSILAARNPRVKVFAFEPSGRELKRFWKNLILNGQNNINVLAYGLSDEEKEQDFVLSEAENTGKNSLPEICFEGETIRCYFSTLNKLLSHDLLKQTKVCKLDVEGQELLILKGMDAYFDLLKQCVFIVEINTPFLMRIGVNSEQIYDFFHQRGFKSQFGNPNKVICWEEFFYHPDYSNELVFQQCLGPAA